MSSIFDLGENKITSEFCTSLGMYPVAGGREYITRHSGTTVDNKRFWSTFIYRRRNPHAPKDEPKHDYVKFNIVVYDFGNRNEIKRTYRNIKHEVELISCMRSIESEFGISIIKNR